MKTVLGRCVLGFIGLVCLGVGSYQLAHAACGSVLPDTPCSDFCADFRNWRVLHQPGPPVDIWKCYQTADESDKFGHKPACCNQDCVPSGVWLEQLGQRRVKLCQCEILCLHNDNITARETKVLQVCPDTEMYTMRRCRSSS